MSRRIVSTISASSTPSASPAVSMGAAGSISATGINGNGPTASMSENTLTSSSTLASLMDKEGMYAELVRLQATVNRLEARIVELKAENTDLQIHIGNLQRGKKGKAAASADSVGGLNMDAEALRREVAKWGKHFVAFYTIIIPASAFAGVPDPAFPHDHPSRYTTPQLKAACLTAELYHVIPDRFHELLRLDQGVGHTSFVKAFREGASGARSKLLQYIKECAPGIFGVPPAYFTKTADSLAQFEGNDRLKKLLGYKGRHPNTKAMIFERVPPLCYRDYECVTENLFTNMDVLKTSRRGVFGQNAAENAERAVSRCISMILRTDQSPETTPGFISAMYTFTRVMLSPDPSFTDSGIGSVTKINYIADFELFKQMIISFADNSPEWWEMTKALWDSFVFATQTKKKSGANDPNLETIDIDGESDEAQINRGLERLTLWKQSTPPTSLPPTGPASVNHVLDDKSDYDDIYNDEQEPDMHLTGSPQPPSIRPKLSPIVTSLPPPASRTPALPGPTDQPQVPSTVNPGLTLAAPPSQSGTTLISDPLTIVPEPDLPGTEPPVGTKTKRVTAPRKNQRVVSKTTTNADTPIEAAVGRATRSKTCRV